MKVTLDSLGFENIPYTYEAQFAEFQKLAKKYNCECVNLSESYGATYVGTPEAIRNLIDNEYGSVDDVLSIYDLNSFEELDDDYAA